MILSWVVALLAGYLATVLAGLVAHATGLEAKPNPIVPQHRQAVAYLGGFGVLGGLAAGVTVVAPSRPPDYVIVGVILFVLLGALDDVRAFRPAAKFLLQLAVAIVVVAAGLRTTLTGSPAIDAALAVFVVLVLVNAVNFTDVCDGLVASLGVVTLLAAAIVLHPPGMTTYVAASGACAGFFLRNRPPARIFLGDAGSHLIGFLLAAAWLGATAQADQGDVLISGAFVCSIFLFELVFITAVRIWKGLPWWRGSPDHFSLRLQAAGWSRGRVDAIAAFTALVTALLGWSTSRVGVVPAALVSGVGCVAASVYLLRHPVPTLEAQKKA
jgi:UDP-GlcNAc:undecaprenyl-phosphate/decaprenyl-phosphate GlcNAc-1-phosphate transferase